MKFIFFILFALMVGCTKKGPTWDAVSLYEMAQKEDPEAKPVLTDLADTEGNLCIKFKYGIGCKKVIRAKVLKLEIIFIEFENTQQAKNEALRIGQFYSRNWVFDDVSGEPALERFMKKIFGAKKPTFN